MAGTVATGRIGGGGQLRADKGGWTPAKRKRFLAELAQTMNVKRSAELQGLTPQGVYRLRQRDPAFAAAWAEALCDGYLKLEMLMLGRALAGYDGDVVEPGDANKLARLSERGALALMAQHDRAVREAREAAAKAAAGDPIREEAGARERLKAKLAEMHERLLEDEDDDAD